MTALVPDSLMCNLLLEGTRFPLQPPFKMGVEGTVVTFSSDSGTLQLFF